MTTLKDVPVHVTYTRPRLPVTGDAKPRKWVMVEKDADGGRQMQVTVRPHETILIPGTGEVVDLTEEVELVG